MEIIYQVLKLPLVDKFEDANTAKASTENVFINVQYNQVVGYGEAAPFYFYHESVGSIIEFFERIKSYFTLSIDK